MYSLLKDIVRFFQDSGELIITNIWVFLFFSLIVIFITIAVYRMVNMKMLRNIEDKYKQVQAENATLKEQEISIRNEISELNSKLEQYYIYGFNDRKKAHTNKDFIDQLNKDFISED